MTQPRLAVLMPWLSRPSFYTRDAAIIARFTSLTEAPCRTAREVARAMSLVRKCDVLLCWFGSIRFLPLAALAKLYGRKVIVIAGGYDVACVPEMRYGNMHHRLPRVLGRLLFRLADLVLPVSYCSAGEARAFAGVPEHKIRVVRHGFDGAEFTAGEGQAREPIVLTVSGIDKTTLRRKGLLTIARTSRLLPEVRFLFAGKASPAALEVLRREAGPNCEFLGFVPDAQLRELFLRARIYCQPSLHEAFGCSVAEAMLSGCVPIVSDRGALPEVVGPAGLTVPAESPEATARAIASVLCGEWTPVVDPRSRIAATFSGARRARELREAFASLHGWSTAAGGDPVGQDPGRQHDEGTRYKVGDRQ